jgi:hypothetical protein
MFARTIPTVTSRTAFTAEEITCMVNPALPYPCQSSPIPLNAQKVIQYTIK